MIPATVTRQLAPIVGSIREGRFVATISCDACNRRDTWTASTMPAPDIVKKKIGARGWALKKKSATCAECLTKENIAMSTPEPAAPSGEVKIAERLLLRTLEDEAYDDKAKRYRPGWSDKRLSDELGLSEKHVASLRDRWFGPAGEPDEVTALRGVIDSIAGELSKVTSDLGQVRNRFEAMCAKNGFKQ